ncbi:hypothetical protein [Tepidibacter hydrothermalis]|uniref:Uncharacterized protein n=1 Tax=Tepidibacter hydrothermalis TaxID=3036126 RepID=A0ABY8E9X4_9FIRM|nr:hypothetical protein [Tepidibacter hydrothermalis]WFD09699.1 hypothetical protein P4S50_15075 [Tepidibacter hydrothermalis]
MDQFDKNQRIRFQLNNEVSLKDALKQYQALLQQDLVYNNGCFDIDFVQVKDGEDYPLSLSDGDINLIKELMGKSEAYYKGEIDFHSTSAEAIFISHCLKNPNLKQDVVDTIKEIVNYSRRHNDTWKMWSDDCAVFGADSVYILGLKYPEYIYLMGSYIIPYWDSEHASYVLSYLEDFYLKNGFTDDLLKAFCYCDNSEARMYMLSIGWHSCQQDPFDLEEYFRKNPDKYEKFKILMKERFKEQRYIQYSEHEYTPRPIDEFYTSILRSSSENEEDYWDEINLEKVFIDDTYDNEAYKLHKEIEEYIGMPLVDEYKNPYDDEDDEDDEQSIWEDFFLNGFDNGEEMLNYILYGEDDSILDEIRPVDIIKLSKEKNLLMYKKIKWFISELDTFEDRFYDIFEGFIEEYYDIDQAFENNNMIVTINGNDTTGRQAVICALDIFYRLMGKKTFPHDLFALIVNSKIMSVSDFIERYDGNNPLVRLIKDLNNCEPIFGLQLERLTTLVYKDRDYALSLLKKHPITSEILVLYTNILYNDYKNRLMDDLSKFLIDIVENNLISHVLEKIKLNGKFKEDEIENIKKYIQGKPMPPRELMMKMMMGKEALTDEEKALLNPKFEPVELDEALNILKSKLDQEEDEDDPQVQYDLFRDYDEGVNSILIALYLGGIKFNLPSSSKFNRLYKLLLELAPIKVINQTSYFYYIYYNQRSLDPTVWYDFDMDIKKVSKDRSIILAWEILTCDSDFYDELVQEYIDDEQPTGFNILNVHTRKDIDSALSLIPIYKQIRFYEEVSERDSDVSKHAHARLFYMSINEFVRESHINLRDLDESEIKNISDDLIKYIEGEIDINEIEYTIDILKDLGGISAFVDRLWRLDEKRQNRALKFLFKFNQDGVLFAYNHHNVEVLDYLDILLNNNVDHKYIAYFLVKYDDHDAFNEYLKSYNPSKYVKNMDIDYRLTALEMASSSSSSKEFIKDFIDDSSNRVSSYAKELLND